MNAHEVDMRRNARRSRRGFSLMELMIVVAITGVLAAIAIPTFTGYLHKARASEATQFLGVIKLKQEAYRAEFGTYLQFTGSAAPADPQVETDAPSPRISDSDFRPTNWADSAEDGPIAFPTGTAFDTLGAKPDGAVRFGYGWAAGLPVDAVPNQLIAEYGMPAADHYFVAQAIADLNGDGTACMFELTSFTRGVWFTPHKGWE
jgi:prepilin-type N-terminal cleavage/methylation domain-containing protein